LKKTRSRTNLDFRIPEHRELFLSSLRMAAGEGT
jgi:hypothetical protein